MNKSRAPAEGGGPSGRVVAVLSRILGSDNARFLREFVRDPIQTAAIAPSSPALAEAMAAVVPSDGHPTVVELGPGTGAIIAAIQRRLGGRGRHLAIERQPRWASLLQQRFPDVDVVHGDVADLTAILTEHDAGPADAIVSGLPWAAYRRAAGRRPRRGACPVRCVQPVRLQLVALGATRSCGAGGVAAALLGCRDQRADPAQPATRDRVLRAGPRRSVTSGGRVVR